MNNYNSKNMNGLLDVVSKKLGMPPEKLKQELASGKFDSALKSMSPSEAAAFNQIVSNPQMLEKFMSTPQVKSLYNKLSNGK